MVRDKQGPGFPYGVDRGRHFGDYKQQLIIDNLPKHTHTATTEANGVSTLNAYNKGFESGATQQDPTNNTLAALLIQFTLTKQRM